MAERRNQKKDGEPANLSSTGGERRTGVDRRDFLVADSSGLERRRGPGRRLSDFLRAAEEGELSQEQFLFVMAIDAFKRANDVTFPAWTDVLEIIRLLGYRKTMPSELNLRNVEDFTEVYNAPAGVRTSESEDREAA